MAAPTNEEQLMLELINEARMDPLGNAARYITSYLPLTSSDSDIQSALSFFGVDGAILQAAYNALVPVRPLAWNNNLADAAQTHSGLMISTQTQSHQVPGEAGLGPRIMTAGYNYNSVGENIYAYSDSVLYGHAGFMVDWGGPNGGMQNPPGHRNNIMSSTFTEIGIDITHENTGDNPLGPLVITQDLGTRGLAFVLGVAYTDTDDNNFYSIGEGRADLNISVGGGGSTTSTSSGGYSLQVSKAGLTVTLTGGGLASAATVGISTVAGNVKLDVVDGNTLLVSDSVTVGGTSITTIRALSASGVSITTGTGSQTLISGSGNDNLTGGAGNDIYYVQSQSDVVFESAGQGTEDTVVSTSNYYLYANIEYLTLAEGAGDIFGVGTSLANTLTGNSGNNLLLGGAGIDFLWGMDGNDTLYGMDDPDDIFGGAGVDYIFGGAGIDNLFGQDGSDALYGEDGDDSLSGGQSFDSDILVGGAGNDTLDGNSGLNEQDHMDGGAGDDFYLVDTTWDLTYEDVGGGTDTVYAVISVPNAGVYLWSNVENLILGGGTSYGVGNGLNNELTGNTDGNWLLGGAGNDTINGKEGADVLFGEAGADTFVFEAGTGGDVIGDFNAAEDTINLDAFNFASFAQLQSAFIQNGAHGAINLGNGDFIVLHNVTMASLNAGDFVL